MRRAWLAFGAAVVLALGVSLTASGAAAPQSISCSLNSGTLSCPIPQTTVTSTVRTTVRSTATKTVTVAPTSNTGTLSTSSSQTFPPTNVSSTPITSIPPGTGFPDASNTGVPAGTELAAYTGPCTIRSPITITNADVSAKCGELILQTKGIKISGSNLPRLDSTYQDGRSGVDVSDSTISSPSWQEGVLWGYNITATRVDVTGGQHSFHCNSNCVLTDSWLHDQWNPAGQGFHNNAFISNGGSNMVIRHNTLACTAILNSTDGGCTGDLSLFGDFDPITNVTIDGNLFKANASSISYCLYAGYSPSKNYPVATGIKVTGNVFERGTNGKCGVYGSNTSFQSSAAGNVWSGNAFDDGTVVNPA